jgi:hypothetical protein
MPYTINKYSGAQVSVVADGTIDSTLDIKLIGKNYAGYGEVQNENFVFMLENFANVSPPPKAITGQIWFDSSSSKLKFYDGSKFRTTGGAEVGATAPTGLTTGDFWFDTTNKQLYAWDGAAFVLVGPQGVAGSGTTQVRSRAVRGEDTITYPIIEAVVDDQTIFVISKEGEFTLDDGVNAITGFSKIQQGITLCYTPGVGDTDEGETTSSHRFWGTASNSEKLGGLSAANFVQSGTATFTGLVNFADAGYTVGAIPKLKVFNESALTPTIRNQANDTIVFQTTVASITVTPLKLVGYDLVPGDTLVSDIGTSLKKYKTIYANKFDGTSTQADALKDVNGTYYNADEEANGNKVARRTSGGNLKAVLFQGTATEARYADLAEKYLADTDYEVGTVLMVGGEKEVTAGQVGFRALGAVSGSPAFKMNSELEGGTYVALKGRVPVKVTGNVIKGQRLVAGPNGTAQAAFSNTGDVFAIALETNSNEGIRLVECVIL